MSFSRLSAVFVAVLAVSVSAAFAAKAPVKHRSKVSKAYPLATFTPYGWPATDEIPAIKEKIRKFESRSLASDYSAGERDLSSKARMIRSEFLQINGAEELDQKIKALDAQYDHLPPDAQYVVAQLAMLEPFRGIVYKTTKLAISTHSSDTVAYYGITQVASLMTTLLPTDQWQAVFDYLVSADPASPGQFQDISYLQDYLVNNVLPKLEQASHRLAKLGRTMGEKPFFFDRLFLYGTANFQDAADNYNFRYKMIGPAEIAGSIASLQFAMHDILVLASYNLEDYLNVKHSLSKLYAEQGILLGRMEDLTAQQRIGTIAGNGGLFGNGYPKYLQARGDSSDTQPDGWYAKVLMPIALKHLQEGVKDLSLAWGVVQSENGYELANQYAVFRPVRILPYSQEIELRLKTLQDMVKGRTAVKSFVTGETVTINLPNYYKNPPADLKDFLPYKFQPKDSTRASKYFRDYFYGQPIGWHLDKYAPYVQIPGNASESYIRDVARIMAQSWAGLDATAPFLIVVR